MPCSAPGRGPEGTRPEAVAEGADALGMAGGDGSLATVAAVAASTGCPSSASLPARATTSRWTWAGPARRGRGARRVHRRGGAPDRRRRGERPDLPEQRLLGVYGEAVRLAGYRDTKVRALAETALRVLAPDPPTLALSLVDDTGQEHARLAVVLVSNNAYA